MKDSSRLLRRCALGVGVAVAALALAACGKKHDVTQSAARVDGTEITVHQINFRLQRERGLRSDQLDAASRKVLDRLIDEQLFVEKAEKEKVDKQPEAQQALDAARREVLARAYVDQVGQGVPPPTEDRVHDYYDNHPELFSRRRIYTVHEYLSNVPADHQPALKAMVDGHKPESDVVTWLRGNNYPVREQETQRAAEQLPLGPLKQLSALQDGEGLIATSGDQVHLTYVSKSDSQPVSFDRAKPMITQFLLSEQRRKAAEGNLTALRSAAKIEYSAPYQALAASSPTMSVKDIEAAAASSVQPPSGERVTLPNAGEASGVRISLPGSPASGVQVSLPTSNVAGVRVSLPATPASSVEVRLPPQAGSGAGRP